MILKEHNFYFKKWNCIIDINKYSNNRIAIALIDKFNHESIAVATVNLPNIFIKEDEVFIKDYSENEGILDTLIIAGIVSEPIKWIQSGFVKVPLCKLLIIEQIINLIDE